MAAEAQEASSNTDAPEQKNSAATSAGRTQHSRNSRVSPSPSASKYPPLELLPGLLAAAVMALYTYYSLQQVKHWITPSWDLAIFTQMAQAYCTSPCPSCPLRARL